MSIFGPRRALRPSAVPQQVPATDLGGKRLTNLGTPQVENDAATRKLVKQSGHEILASCATREYVDNTAQRIAQHLRTAALALDGSNEPTRTISWGNQRISYLAEPKYSADAATKGYVDRLIDNAHRFHFRLYSPLSEKGLVTIVFNIPNTDERFGGDLGLVFVSLTPLGSPILFCVDNIRLDRNYLQLAIAVFVREGHPSHIGFNVIVEITSSEQFTVCAPPRRD